ncbi:MAG: alpha/beta fold hydrolase [Acidimicrobiia bacterium]
MSVYFAHGTGFCGGVWRPVIDVLENIPCVAWDFAGHGSGPPLEFPVDWRIFAEQVLAETEPGGIGVGHSMGSAALVMAQLLDPDRFRFLVLVEPIILPGPPQPLEHPVIDVAVKRRRRFKSREAARAVFAEKEPFSGWHPSALDGYLECGLVGDGPVELACPPELEAEIFRASTNHDTWDRLGEVEIPVLILAGDEGDPLPPDLFRAQAAQFPRAGVEIVPGVGHFLPMEKPELVAERVRRVALI